jgi:hypothetical protein
MHLYGHRLDRYLRRDLPAHQLSAIDTHVSNCLFCAHALAEQTAVSTAWERRGWLGRLVRVETPVQVADRIDDLEVRAA